MSGNLILFIIFITATALNRVNAEKKLKNAAKSKLKISKEKQAGGSAPAMHCKTAPHPEEVTRQNGKVIKDRKPEENVIYLNGIPIDSNGNPLTQSKRKSYGK